MYVMARVKESSTNSQNRRCLDSCNLTYAAGIVGGRWKMLIINHLQAGVLRFSELRRKIPASTERMLTLQLRELEAAGMVTRTVYAEVPPRVEYALTASGSYVSYTSGAAAIGRPCPPARKRASE